MEIEVQETEKKEGKYPGFDDYEVEHAAETLMKAEKIKSDAKLMEAVKMCLSEKKKIISSIADLKKARAKMNEMPEEPSDSDSYSSEEAAED